ncbi:Fungalysin/Thermolysin Extracellular metalloproteinase 5, partial [Borealophlyctis nickersoniae]
MAPSKTLSLALAGLLTTSAAVAVAAHPHHDHHKTAGTRPRSVGNFGPDLSHRKFEHGVDRETGVVSFLTEGPAAAAFGEDSWVDVAIRYVAEKLNLDKSNLKVSSSHTSKHNGVTHVYLQQLLNGIEVANGVGNVNIDRYGRVISFGNSFHSIPKKGASLVMESTDSNQILLEENSNPIPPPTLTSVTLGPSDAVLAFAKFINLEITADVDASPVAGFAPGGSPTTAPSYVVTAPSLSRSPIPATLKYIQKDATTLRLVWDIEVEMRDNMYNAFVDTQDGKVVSVVDWVADADYNIYPLGTNDPLCGDRVLVENPAHSVASPRGWHTQGRKNYTTTKGNNVIAHENFEGESNWVDNYRPDGGKSLSFDFPVDFADEPKTYIDAAVTNLFFWNNVIHDLFYVYGFDEAAGNFQYDNFGRGGKGGDAVIANAQDGSGYNNANFMTPRDGRQPRMRMYIWDSVSPMRDGDLEGGIVMHEYAHGISTRLTGGPDNVNCLGWGESGGMGEGWGDFFATITRTTPNSTRTDVFGMGEYANGGEGIRKYKYSTSKEVNPSTYGFITRPGYWGVHAKGEVWAEILYEVFWNLVDKHG